MIRQGKYTKRLTPLQKAKRYVRRRWAWFKGLSKPKKALVIGGPILVFLIVTPLATYAYFARDIADKERLMNRNNTGIVLMDKSGEAFYRTGRAEHREQLSLDAISDNTEHALIASEDKGFYDHPGFSIGSMLGALYANFTSGATEYGGSTLTQQLAKNTLLSEDRNYLRKYQELSVSIAIERTYSKDEILSMYLNSVYYGEGAFGIEDAAKTYFDKSAADLTLAESAMLIGLLPAPANYSPISGDPELAKERQEVVLDRMVKNEYITEAEKQAALAEQLVYHEAESLSTSNIAPHFTQMVLNELYEKYGEERVTRSGYQVRTTLDLNLQRKLTENIANHLDHIQANDGSNASGIAIDPTSGEIRALVGSADWNNQTFGKVNMVTTPRQPGSTFKSIYYADGLARGVITPATILKDEATDFGGYRPQNATRMYYGNVTARSALARSLNIPAVKVMQKVGLDNSIAAAKKMGITTLKDDTDYGLSLAIGSAEVPLIEMTNAYAAYANQGQQFSTTTVRQINNKFDDNIFKAKETSKEVISKEGAYLLSSILSDNNARAPMFGSALTVPGRTVAVKTGTTDDSKDAWTIGYTPQIAIGVWVGNNDNTIMQSGGSDMAGPIWMNTMKAALEGSSNTEFTMPSGVTKRNVCTSNGGLANTAGRGVYSEYFLTTALPTNRCTVNTEDEDKAREKAKEEERKREEEAKKAAEKAAEDAAKQAEKDSAAPPPEEETPPDEQDPATPTDPASPSGPTTPSNP